MNLVNGREGQREHTDCIGPVEKTTAPTMVSFGGEKESLIRSGGFSAFIRKQGRRTCPRSIYFYIAKPVGAIVAHAIVTGYGWVTLQQALGEALSCDQLNIIIRLDSIENVISAT